MTAPTAPTAPPLPSSAVYPFATSPDIIRSNQKDAYSISTLQSTLTDVLRRLYGSRFTHNYATETETFTHLLYLSLTTLIGNRTLGEEYTDIYQIETSKGHKDSRQRLPAVGKRAGYILLAVLVPYALNKTLPTLRRRIRNRLERNLANGSPGDKETSSRRIQAYLLTHLNTITSTAPLQALTLTIFYFTGSYYHLSKRLVRLRYIFSKRLSKSEEQARVGYEVLGVLLVVQVLVQVIIHARATFLSSSTHDANNNNSSEPRLEDSYSSESKDQRIARPITTPLDSRTRIALKTHTPLPLPPITTTSSTSSDLSSTDTPARYNLSTPQTLSWLQPTPQRKCTLCLDFLRDPSVTTCGHVFCWTCIHDWVREKAACPLCRQEVLAQHVLPLRG